ncbi:hypothetical protein TNCV_2363661 [Trichonephila clavipes]|nr:hypothetical protein TNCV_2363661 [Trichonephila clavipes]
MMIPAYNKKRYAAFPFETGVHFWRKTDFFLEEDTTLSYSGFEPEPTRLQAEENIQTNLYNPHKYPQLGFEDSTPDGSLFEPIVEIGVEDATNHKSKYTSKLLVDYVAYGGKIELAIANN